MRRIRVFALAVGLAAFTAAPALAQLSWGPVTGCGGNAFDTCITGGLSWDGLNGIIVTVTNLDENVELGEVENWDDVLMAVGLIGVDASLTVSSITALDQSPSTLGSEAISRWGMTNDLSGGGLANVQWGSGPTTGSPNTYALLEGMTGVFQFTFSDDVSQAQFLAMGIGVHGISGPNGCSTKMGLRSNGAVDNYDLDHAIAEGCISVPEPASSALLATGLMGLAVIVRRRRGAELVDENGDNTEI